MKCPGCGRDTPPHLERCTACGAPLAAPPTPTSLPTLAPGAAEASGTSARTTGPLAVGQSFGRYHIIRLVGVGGMGVVYEAWDSELAVAVAIKVIRPQITDDPAEAELIEKRFKRELVLARQVTHRHVVRIHDLGQIDGIKYITMPYVEGANLEAVLAKKGPLPVARALAIARQVALGLQAAHEVGVVHRDFKPANILIDEEGTALVTDFGIARSMSAATFGTAGVIGTVEYMAPEQARGAPVDQRADIYAFGLVLYDMLLGSRRPRVAETGVAELMTRMQSAPPHARSVDPAIPEALDAILDRCLQPDPAARYQTTGELVAALEQLDANGHPSAPATRVPAAAVAALRSQPVSRRRIYTAAAVAVGVVVAMGVPAWLGIRGRTMEVVEPPPPARAVSLAILPFRNASGDPSLDWLGASVAESLRTGLGVSSSLHVVSSDRVHQVLADLRLAADASFDAAALRRLADFTSADTVVWGQFVKFGEAVAISGTLTDLRADRSVPLKAEAANQGLLIAAVDGLARSVRASLAVSPEASRELEAAAVKPSTQSLEALRAYNEGLALARQGKQAEALKRFEAATSGDPHFALAFAKLGQTYANLNYDDEAVNFSRRAVALSEQLEGPERYLVLATHARIINDTKKSIESYEQLLKISPNDPQVRFDLATLYENTGALDQARDHFAKALESDGKWVDALLAMGRVETRRRNVDGSLDYLNRALTLTVQLENDEARSRVLQAIGISYKRLNKPEEALRHYRESLAIKRRLGQKGGMAASLAEIGQVEARLGHPDNALDAYTEALQLRREIGDKRGVGNTLLDLGAFHANSGRNDEALRFYRESLQVQREVGDQNYEALLLNNIGNVYLNKAQYDDAITNFDRALQLREKANVPADMALTLNNLAATSALLGQYDRSLEYHLRALELWRKVGDRRNGAAESYSMAVVFEHQGRYGAAIKAAAEAVATLREIRDRSAYLAEALSVHGEALAQAGRFEESARALGEALAIAREVRARQVVAETLNRLGDLASFRGDAAAALDRCQEALPDATATGDRALILRTRLSIANATLRTGRAPAARKEAMAVAAEAERLGLVSLAAEAGVTAGEAMARLKQLQPARRSIERAMTTGERLGLTPLLVRAHAALGGVLAASGSAPDGLRHHTEARRLLDQLAADAGSADVLKRADFASITARFES